MDTGGVMAFFGRGVWCCGAADKMDWLFGLGLSFELGGGVGVIGFGRGWLFWVIGMGG